MNEVFAMLLCVLAIFGLYSLCHAYFSGDAEAAARAQLGALALMDASMAVVNPIPIKTMCAMLGLCREEFRLPLCPMLPAQKRELSELLHGYGLVD